MTADELADAAASSEKVRVELAALERKGRLAPHQVVEWARDNPGSALYAHFEWDDASAAHQHRIETARKILRRVTIEIVTEQRTIRSPYYVRDPKAGLDEQGYVSVHQLRREPVQARRALNEEFANVHARLRRAERIAEALGLQDEVRAVADRVGELRELVVN